LTTHKEKREIFTLAMMVVGISLLSAAFGIYNTYEIGLLKASLGDHTNILDGLAQVTADTLDKMDNMTGHINDLHNITRMTLEVSNAYIARLALTGTINKQSLPFSGVEESRLLLLNRP
jgi:hypothetical protein